MREGQLFGVSNKDNYIEIYSLFICIQNVRLYTWDNVKLFNGLMVHVCKKRGHGKGTIHFLAKTGTELEDCFWFTGTAFKNSGSGYYS